MSRRTRFPKRFGMTRREFVKAVGMLGAAYWLGPKLMIGGRVYAEDFLPGGTLEPTEIDKYGTPLIIPPAMPRTSKITGNGGEIIDYYEIAVRQFQQQILPAGLPETTVWSYGSVNHPDSFNYPAFTIEARWRRPVRVKWINGLVDAEGNFLPHLLPVDPTLHWANPPRGSDPNVYGEGPRDSRPAFIDTPGPYTGPVPMVTHLHGAAGVGDESDGYAEAWFVPAADNIPEEYAKVGSWYNTFRAKAGNKFGVTWDPGTAVFQYPNDHRAATLWYHDHTLGITRLNVYAGPAGFYLLRGGPDDRVLDSATGQRAELPGPAPTRNDPPGTNYYEIPIVIQDRSFNADGSLFYPDSREFFDDIAGPYIPFTDISPIWNPEFFGNAMVVNGRAWPFLEVEQRRYRFRFLNGCNSRFLILKFNRSGLRFWHIGTEGGFLPAPVEQSQVLLGPAERADVIVDFTDIPVDTRIRLLNLGPDEPFGGGVPGEDFPTADPNTTGQVMQFRVVAAMSVDTSTPPKRLVVPEVTPLEGGRRRPLALTEESSAFLDDAPTETHLGPFDTATGTAIEKSWDDPVTENPEVGATEVWELHNLTVDAHPIHIHEIHFQIVNRQQLIIDEETGQVTGYGEAREPDPSERGFKDTVIAYPGEVARLRARFDVPGRFVWHCHVVEHEDNEMMRPYHIGPIPEG